MKKYLLLFLTLLFSLPVFAQNTSQSIRESKTDPNGQACTTGVSPVLYYNNGFYKCSAGSYSAISLGGGGSLSDGDYGDITVGSSGTAMTIDSGVITDAKVNASAAIAYSKLNLTGAILNADLAGSIAISKLAITGTPTGSKYLRDDGSWQTIAGGGDAQTSSPLSQFASTTSAQLAGVISDETGNGALIFGTAPTITSATLVTPNIAKISNLVSNGFVRTGSGDGTLSIDTATYLNAANNLSDLANASTARTNLGVVIGTNVQAYDADLTIYAGITPSANVQSVLGAANYAAIKTLFSLNNVENTALSTWAGTTNVTTLGTISTGTWNGSVIGTAYGGAGTANGILKANGSGTVSAASAGTDYVSPSSSETLTNKTVDAEGTGNAITLPYNIEFIAAGVNAGTAAPMLDIPSSNGAAAAAITSGTNTLYAVLDFDAATDESAQGSFQLPTGWTGNVDVDLDWMSAATSGNVIWAVQCACVAASESSDPSWNTAGTVTDAAIGTTNQRNTATISALTTTGCAAGERMHFKVYRDADAGGDTMTGDARLKSLTFTIRVTR